MAVAEYAPASYGSLDWRESARNLCAQLDRIGDAVVVILDDYHEVDGETEVESLFDFLLGNLPEQVRVILSSRTNPRLSVLPALMVQRRATRIGKQALRLSPDEVRSLMREVYGQGLSPEQARVVCEACEGWVAGLMLMTAEGGIPQGVSGKLEVADYFRHVVVGRLEEEAREFLLATSVLTEISVPVCDRLLDRADSGAMLEEHHRGNLFIERLELEPPVYRYHGLFRDFLYNEFQRENPTALRALHRCAGRIYLYQHDSVTAAHHFIAATDYERAAHALALISGKQLAEASRAVAELLDSIPEEAFRLHPRALLTRARIYYRGSEMDKSVDAAAQAFLLMRLIGDVVGMAEAEVLRATALKHRGEIRLAVKACRNALNLLEGHEGSPSVSAEALLQMGICRGLQGRSLEATKVLRRAWNIWIRMGELEREGITSEALGSAFIQLGNPEQAHAYYEKAREAWTRLGYDSALTRLVINTASLHLLQGEYEAACEALEMAFARLRTSPDIHLEALAWVNLAELKRDVQLYDEALRYYLVGREKARECLDSWFSVYAAEGMATALRLRGQFESAELLLRDVLPQAEDVGDRACGLVLISLAAVNVQWGRYDQAREQIDRAIRALPTGRVSIELARAHFWRAKLAYRTGRLEEVREALMQVAASLGRAYALPLADLRGGQRLLKHAVVSGIEPELFATLARKARANYARLAGRGGVTAAKQPGPTAIPTLTIQALGEAVVRIDGRTIPGSAWRSEKAKELFFFLAWQSRAMRRLEIESALWPEFNDARAHTNFRVSVFRARQAVFPDAITFSGGRYELNRKVRVQFDAREFVELTNSARRYRPGSPERAPLLQRACQLYDGPFLDGTYSEWSISIRNGLETQYLSALIEVADCLEREGEHRESIIWYEKAIKIDPLLEAAYEGLIRANVALSDFGAARHHYRRYQSVVQTELNEEPPEYLRRLISD